MLLGFLIYFLWGSKWLWIIVVIIFVLSLALHSWYHYKTEGWSKSYGLWKYEESKLKDKIE